MPKIREPTDVIIKVLKTTISPDDLDKLKGNTAAFAKTRRLGQECIGEITEVGNAVSKRKIGQRVLVSSITSCGHCVSCKSRLYGDCQDGGWLLGHRIDGVQGTHARVPHGDYSTFPIPSHVWDTELEDDLILCSDILPAVLEMGLVDGGIKYDMTIAIVGAGIKGMAAFICAGLYAPREVYILGVEENQLEAFKFIANEPEFESTRVYILSKKVEDVVDAVLEQTNDEGVDLVIETTGTPDGWYQSQDIVREHGQVTMVGGQGRHALKKTCLENFTLTAGIGHGYSTASIMR